MTVDSKTTETTTDFQAISPENLPTDVRTLQLMVQQLLGQVNDQAREVLDLQQQLAWLKRQLFGRKSEKMNPNQRLLFKDMYTALQAQLEAATTDDQDAEQSNTSNAKKKTRKQGSLQDTNRNGRVPLPADLPRVPEYLDPDLHGMPDARCIGEDITEILEYIPAGFYVRQIIRRKYVSDAFADKVIMAPLPDLPIKKGRPGPGVIAYLLTSKYCDHLPLYRLEDIFERNGLHVARSTQCDWVRAGAELLEPIVDELKRQILSSPKIHTDDTSIHVQDKSRTHLAKGYLWPYIDIHNNVYFDFTSHRNRAGPESFFDDYQGIIQADAFSGYDNLFGKDKASEAGCWAHARRKFDESLASDTLRANEMLALIGQLYAIEEKVRQEDLSVEEIKSLRQQFSKPILLDKIKPLLDEWQLTSSILPSSPLGKAVTYAQNQWDALLLYLEDGLISIDNGLAERMIKLVALGRRNWLFAGSKAGAKRMAIIYSLVASCKLCKIDPFIYFRDILERINTHPASRVSELVPHRWKELYLPAIKLPSFKSATAATAKL
jgi:transposase